MSQSARLCRTYLIEIIKRGYRLIGPFIDRKTAQAYAPLHEAVFSNDNTKGHLTPVCLASPLCVSLTAPYRDTKPIRCGNTNADSKVYVMSVHEGQMVLVGPFETRESAYWWNSACEVSPNGEVDWLIVALKNPYKIIHTAPEPDLYHKAITQSVNAHQTG